MKILICNDDGIDAYGLRCLAKVLSKKHTVTVVAPKEERSAVGHGITCGDQSITVSRADFDGITAYAVDGTPADCVKFGCLQLNVRPDMIIAGVNHGNNIGSEVICSGTVSAASEGAYLGFPSCAVSCGTQTDTALLAEAARFVDERLRELTERQLPPFTIFSINYPDQPALGYVYTRMGVQLFSDHYVRDGEHYYLRGERIDYPQNPEDCDVRWLKKKFVTITPLKIDRTDEAFLSTLPGGIPCK